MPKFAGQIRNEDHSFKRVIIEGDTLKDAMDKAGLMPMHKIIHVNRLVGQLTTGQRFSFRVHPIRPEKL